MEIVISVALVLFFWYAAYKAWTMGGRVPETPEPEHIVVVSHNHRTADFYAGEFGLKFDKRTHIASNKRHLHGYDAKNTHFIYVNADNAKPDREVVEMLKFYEAMGAKVDWVGFEGDNNEQD